MTAFTTTINDTIGIEGVVTFKITPIPHAILTVAKPDTLFDPSWSPDGTTLVYTQKTGSTFKICTQTVGATVVNAVLQSGSNMYADPMYSADGTLIVFSEQTGAVSGPHPAGQWRLKYMNSDGTGLVTILDDGNANIHPVWLNATQIAFQSWQYGATPSSAYEVSIIGIAGLGRFDLGIGEYPRTVTI